MIYHAIMLWLIFNELVLLGVLNMPSKEDWERRSQGRHLNEEEIARLCAAFAAGRCSLDIARELECSSRSANKYYAIFRGTPQKNGRPDYRKPIPRIVATPRPESKSRFYKSNFEI